MAVKLPPWNTSAYQFELRSYELSVWNNDEWQTAAKIVACGRIQKLTYKRKIHGEYGNIKLALKAAFTVFEEDASKIFSPKQN